MSNVPPPPGGTPPPPAGGGFPPPPGGTPPPPAGGGFPPPPGGTPPPSGGTPPPAGGGGFAPPPAAPQPGYGQPAYGQPAYGPPPRAGFGSRLGAYIIDYLIVGALFIPGWLVLIAGPKEIGECPDSISTNPLDVCEVPTDATTGGAFLLFGLAALAGVAYFAIMEGKGATVGKKSVGLRVVDMHTGQPIGTGRAIGRYFARILSAIPCYLGFLWMLWDDKQQTWHDKMTSSFVLKDQ